MAERAFTDDDLAAALVATGRRLAVPNTPPIAPTVSARLSADRAARARPPLARRFAWTPRRTLALATAAVLGLLALAAGARFVLGAAEIRVQPGITPTGPPLAPGGLGAPVAVDEVAAAVGFDVLLPVGRPPDEAFAVTVQGGGAGALLAWDAGADYPALPGTPWGLIVLEVESDEEVVVKSVNAFEDTHPVRVGGGPGFWVDAEHELIVVTDRGEQRFSVQGNVLVWREGDLTLRMETTLGRAEAVALAESVA